MFNKTRFRFQGYETFGKIIEIKEVPPTYMHAICIKKITVQYNVNYRSYQVTQDIYLVMPKHSKVMKIGNLIRIKVNENNPSDAYINEFDYPEYEIGNKLI